MIPNYIQLMITICINLRYLNKFSLIEIVYMSMPVFRFNLGLNTNNTQYIKLTCITLLFPIVYC